MSNLQESTYRQENQNKAERRENSDQNLQEKNKKLKEMFKPYSEGMAVAVKRTSGEIENDWIVAGTNENGNIIVTKIEKETGDLLKKTVKPEELQKTNPEANTNPKFTDDSLNTLLTIEENQRKILKSLQGSITKQIESVAKANELDLKSRINGTISSIELDERMALRNFDALSAKLQKVHSDINDLNKKITLIGDKQENLDEFNKKQEYENNIDDYSEDIENNQEEFEPLKSLKPLSVGSFLNVKRSNGKIESDWIYSGMNGDNYVLYKKTEGGQMKRSCSVEEVKELNSQNKIPVFDNNFVREKLQEAKELLPQISNNESGKILKLWKNELNLGDFNVDNPLRFKNQLIEVINHMELKLKEIPKQEERIEDLISKIEDFDQLDKVLDHLTGINSSIGYENNNYWKQVIGQVKDGKVGINKITSKYGLRAKVQQLLQKN